MNKNANKNHGPVTAQMFAQACLGSCQKLVMQIETAKDNIVAEFADVFAMQKSLLNHAINQADALAWQTGFPHLFFPALATERVEAAARWNERQQQLLRQQNFAETLSI